MITHLIDVSGGYKIEKGIEVMVKKIMSKYLRIEEWCKIRESEDFSTAITEWGSYGIMPSKC